MVIMKRKILLTLIGLFVISGISWSQLAITRTSFNGTYTPITTVGGATVSTATGDDGTQALIPLGFTFNYLGTNYTTIDLCTNGWISFGASGSNQWDNTALFTTGIPNNTVAPWWDDLYVVGAGAVLYQLQGTPGSQTFTVQWTNVNSYQNTLPFNTINFQVILYEGTNQIEFRYGSSSTSTPNTNETASIGLENSVGGNGNYLDAITGSSKTGNAMLNTSTKWPTLFYRFTPGAPTALAGGTYSVGIGQTYPTLSEAVADVNHRGVSGAVTLNLVDANYNVTPAGGHNTFPILLGPVAGTSLANIVTITSSVNSTISYDGAVSGNCSNQASNTAIGTGNEPILGLIGSQYAVIQNLNLVASTNAVDRGIAVYNSSSTLGSQFNAIRNVNVTLNRTNTATVGILQQTIITPTNTSGSNSFNLYTNFNISNTYSGMHLNATSAGFPDISCIIANTSPTGFNTIGGATANDIGNAGTATFGLQLTNQANDTVRNTEIRNVTVTGSVAVEGLILNAVSGNTSVFNNKIHDIRCTSTSSTSNIIGIRANASTVIPTTLGVYNNFVYNLRSGYTGAATATRAIKGIFTMSAGGGTGSQNINVDFNNVSIDVSSNPNISSTCFEIGSVSTLNNTRDNIFGNFTGAQAGVAKHYTYRTPGANTIGSAGSTCNFNDLYIANATNGFVGLANATDLATLANWQATITGQDANSVSFDPLFVSNTADLHVTAIALIGAGTAVSGISKDIDNANRPGTPTIGADEIVACASASGGTISPSTFTRCANQTVTMTSTGATAGGGITYQWMVSGTPGGPYSNVSGGSGATTTSYTSGALSAGTFYYVMQTTCSIGPVSGLSNEVTVTVNPLPTITATPPAGTYCPTIGVSISGSGGLSYTWLPAAGLSATTGSPVVATPGAATTYTVTGTDVNGCTATATSIISIGELPVISSVTATPPAVCFGGNSQLLATGATTSAYTVTNIPYINIPTPGAGVTTLSNAGVAVTPLFSGSLDDGGWANQTLPFGFSFFGNYYTSFSISTNGFMYLGTGAPATFSGYNNTMPNAASMAHPVIGAIYSDLDFRVNGTIEYFVVGTAPNRQFVMNWKNGQFYNGVGALNTQLIIYETTNIIEVHTTNSTGNNNAVEGIQNAAGTTAVVVPGRNNTLWPVVTPDGYRWSPSGGPLTYAWTPPTFLTSTTIANPMANGVTSTTTYTVTVTNGGCSATGTTSVSAGSALVSGALVTNSPVCEGSNFNATASPSGGGAPYTYKWNYGAGQFTTPGATFTSNTIAPGSYTLTSTVLDACGDSTTQSAPFTINARPTVSIGTTPASQNICPGTTYTMTASGATSYAWSPATYLSATTGTNVNVSGTVSGYTNVTYLMIGTDGNGCSDSASQQVTLAPNHDLTVTSSAPSVCSGAQVDLTVVDSVFASGPASLPLGYCAAGSGTCDEAVNGFTFVTINNTSACTGGGYTNNLSISTSVLPGSSHPVSVTTTLYYSGDQCYVWGDWNRDGDFVDAGEQTILVYSGSGGVFNGTVNVPAGAQLGATRLRVRMNYTGAVLPCGSPTYGEVEDYKVIIGYAGLASGPNTYTWNPVTTPPTGQMVSDFPTTSTNYIVTATDSIGCTNMDSVFVNVDAVVATLAPIDITCNGANDGSFSMTGYTCGTPGFAFSVDGGSFGPIPTNLTPGSHSVIVRDTVGGLSSPINIMITQPSWTVPSPTVTNAIICVGDPSAILTGSVAIADTVTIVVPFNVTTQPTETNFAPGNAVGTGTVPSIPAGSNIISAVLSYPNLNTVGFSYNADVNLGFSGSVTDAAAPDPSATFTAGLFNYNRSISIASINTAGGTATLLYWDDFDDNFGSDETMFPTGATAATLTIKYLPAANISWWTAPTAGTNLANNDSLESVGTSVLPNTNTSGVYNFYAEAEYSGCYSSSRTLSTVTVGAYPVVNLGPDSSYCVTHTLNAGNPGLTYVWNDGSTTQTITALDTGIYWVDVTSAFGCTTRDSIILTINPLPVVDLGPDTSSCGSYLLDPGPQYPGSAFLWSDLSSNPTLLTTSSGDFNVTVTDVNGCSNADTVTVNVPPITYNNLGPDTTLCTNANGFTLDATTVGVTYLWQDGSTNPTFFVNLPGTYWCAITNFVGCTYTDTVIVTSVNPVQTNINVNFITTTSATLDAGSGFSSYLWSTSGSTQVITVTTNGTYYVEVMDGNNCITTDTVSIIFSLGVFNPNGTATTMKLYPNPSEGVFNLSIDNLETSDLVMEILDMNGKVVYNKYVGSVSGSTIEPFSLTTLRVGTYTLRLTANGKSSSLRFIINK
jgi:hypothetical protein